METPEAPRCVLRALRSAGTAGQPSGEAGGRRVQEQRLVGSVCHLGSQQRRTGPLENGEKTSDCDDALGMSFCWRFSKAGRMRVTWDLSQADGEGRFPDHPG